MHYFTWYQCLRRTTKLLPSEAKLGQAAPWLSVRSCALIMRLSSLVAVGLALLVHSEEVQHLRGESKKLPEAGVKEETNGKEVTEEVGAVSNEDQVPQDLEKEGEDEDPEEVGVVFEELDSKEGSEEASEEDEDESKEKSGWPRRRRPWSPGPGRRRPGGGGCRTWVSCTNGWYRGVRCSGGRYCTRWR